MAEPRNAGHQVAITPSWSLRNAAGEALPPRLVELLVSVEELGSMLQASRATGMSYRQALVLIRRGEALLEQALLVKTRRHGSTLTPLASKLVAAQRRFQSRLAGLLRGMEGRVQAELGLAPAPGAEPAAGVDPARQTVQADPGRGEPPEPIGHAPACMEDDPLRHLLVRRSVSPKRLGAPAPGPAQIDLMLQAALRAPDHGGLHPWRVIEFRDDQRAALADCFEAEKQRRDPLASAADLRRAREHATRSPALLAFVVSPRSRSKVPVREQWLAAGAALGNLLNATHQLGYGAIVLSGERCFDAQLLRQLGIAADEHLAGFVSLGTIAEAPPAARPTLPGKVWSCWTPLALQGAAAGTASLKPP